MPEGPSIVILRESLQEFTGKKVKSASGNAKIDIDSLEGKTVREFQSWGKQLFICFPGFFVRIHLLLFGSYTINETKDMKPRLSLVFSNGEVHFYNCSVKLLEGKPEDTYDWEVDVMSETFNKSKAEAALKALKQAEADDVLLNQEIFAGSGNIVKNEVLFRLKIHPQSDLKAMPEKKIKDLVKETQHYCHQFYEWKKKFELKKHWEAYRQRECPRCHIPFLIKPTGKNNRRSYFCENCQVLYKKEK